MPAKAMFLSSLDISLSEYLVRIYFGLFSFLGLLAIRDPELSVRAPSGAAHPGPTRRTVVRNGFTDGQW